MGIQLSYCNGADPIRPDMGARPREAAWKDYIDKLVTEKSNAIKTAESC